MGLSGCGSLILYEPPPFFSSHSGPVAHTEEFKAIKLSDLVLPAEQVVRHDLLHSCETFI